MRDWGAKRGRECGRAYAKDFASTSAQLSADNLLGEILDRRLAFYSNPFQIK